MHDIVGNKYKKLQLLGNGSFGTIYIGENIITKENVAIKVEPISNELKLLKNESRVYQYLNNIEGIPKLKWFGLDNENYYMVIPLLGGSLKYIKEKYNKFSPSLVLNIGFQMLTILRDIHSKGLVHRDIKPDNFLLDKKDSHKIYLIDFGFCKNILDKNNNHIEMKKTRNIIGTPLFISINAHDCCELSRRDDLQSVGFLLLYLYYGSLPWENIQNITVIPENNVMMKTKKIAFINGLKYESGEMSLVFLKYFESVLSLEFKEKPDYEFLINLFTVSV